MDMCISMANKLVEMDWSQEFNAKDPQLLFDMYHKVTFTMQVMPVSLNELYVAWQSKTWIVTMEEEHNITEDLKKLMFVHKQFNETILIHKLDQIGSQISNLIKLFCEDQEVC
jgi:hypothetical protein